MVIGHITLVERIALINASSYTQYPLGIVYPLLIYMYFNISNLLPPPFFYPKSIRTDISYSIQRALLTTSIFRMLDLAP